MGVEGSIRNGTPQGNGRRDRAGASWRTASNPGKPGWTLRLKTQRLVSCWATFV